MHRLRKKHCEPWYGRIYYAADKQSGVYLLQQYFVRCRRRYLHICYDDCVKRASVSWDSNLCNEWGHFPNFKLQLWCMSSSASAKSHGSDEYYDSWLYSSDVEYYYFIPECIDWNFQLWCGLDAGCSSGIKNIFCGIYFYGSAIHWTNGF